jgi:hypothetical protein
MGRPTGVLQGVVLDRHQRDRPSWMALLMSVSMEALTIASSLAAKRIDLEGWCQGVAQGMSQGKGMNVEPR